MSAQRFDDRGDPIPNYVRGDVDSEDMVKICGVWAIVGIAIVIAGHYIGMLAAAAWFVGLLAFAGLTWVFWPSHRPKR